MQDTQELSTQIDSLSAKNFDAWVNFRQTLHQNPETTWNERETSDRIAEQTVRTVLRRLFTTRAVPRFLRSDNGGEFIARSTALLLHEAKCTARFIQPGKPWQNGFIESFHSILRRDHLEVEVFFNLLDAQLKTGIYRNYYNQVRPHSALGYKAPTEYATMKAGSLM